MFSYPVKRTQILGFDPGADAFVSNSDDSLERQWKTSGWEPHIKIIHSGICLEMKKGSNAQELPWAPFNLLIKETNSYIKRRISLRHAYCFPADNVNLSTLARHLKLKPLLFVQTGKRSRADPPNLCLDSTPPGPVPEARSDPLFFLTFNEFLSRVILKQSNLFHLYCWKNAQLFTLLSFVKLFSFSCAFLESSVLREMSILLPYFSGKLLVNLFSQITSFL